MSNTSETAAAVNTFVDRIEAHQKALGLSDTAFCQRYARYIGSTRTWRDRLVGKQFQGMNLAAYEVKLRNFVAELDGHSPVETFVERLPFSARATAIYQMLQAVRTDRRCGVILASTGCGKSAWARWIVNQNPREAVFVRASEIWRDSLVSITQGLALALGCAPADFAGAAANLNRIIANLRMQPKTILIDESHSGGTVLMKVIKTLIDETACKFVMLGYPTSWNKMLAATEDSRIEAQQLYGRTLKPVFSEYAQGTKRGDVAALLRALTTLEEEADQVAGQILSTVRTNGNLRLVADAVESAELQAETEGIPFTGALLVDHVRALCPTGGAK